MCVWRLPYLNASLSVIIYTVHPLYGTHGTSLNIPPQALIRHVCLLCRVLVCSCSWQQHGRCVILKHPQEAKIADVILTRVKNPILMWINSTWAAWGALVVFSWLGEPKVCDQFNQQLRWACHTLPFLPPDMLKLPSLLISPKPNSNILFSYKLMLQIRSLPRPRLACDTALRLPIPMTAHFVKHQWISWWRCCSVTVSRKICSLYNLIRIWWPFYCRWEEIQMSLMLLTLKV